jgi:RNA polymerase sigma-70 factor (ECF subfamily)
MPATQISHTEEELVALLRKGDEQSFSVLYSCYCRALLGVIRKNISDEDVADDLLQEVFVKIWNNRAAYDESRGRLYTWMLNIARNSSIDYLRSRQNRMDEKIQRGENSVHAINNSGSVQMNTDTIGIRKIVSQLKDDHKLLIDLAYFEGFTQEEIAGKLGIPLGTVKTRVRAALTALRKIVK